MPSPKDQPTRDEKVENLVTNFSMIMMGMFEGVFAALAAGMATALSKTADALTEALDSPDGNTPPRKPAAPDVDKEVKTKVKEVFSGLRKEVAEGFSNKDNRFKEFIKDPAFDDGIRIVESHRLKLPSLTEPLTDSELAGYVDLIQKGDPEISKLMQELGEWQKSTPRFGR
jgi:hypothetical protein